MDAAINNNNMTTKKMVPDKLDGWEFSPDVGSKLANRK